MGGGSCSGEDMDVTTSRFGVGDGRAIPATQASFQTLVEDFVDGAITASHYPKGLFIPFEIARRFRFQLGDDVRNCLLK